MEEPTIEAITQRLERLERDNRRWKRLAGGAVACLGLAVILGAAPSKKARIPDEVRARRFVLMDKADNIRADLTITEEGQPHLVLLDDARKPRLVLSLRQYGEPALSLVDAAGKERIVLGLDLYGALLRVSDAGGHLRAALAVPTEGEPELALLGKDDKTLWRVP